VRWSPTNEPLANAANAVKRFDPRLRCQDARPTNRAHERQDHSGRSRSSGGPSHHDHRWGETCSFVQVAPAACSLSRTARYTRTARRSRVRFVAQALEEPESATTPVAASAGAEMGQVVRFRATSRLSEGITAKPITSRETPTHAARTSFRHRQVRRACWLGRDREFLRRALLAPSLSVDKAGAGTRGRAEGAPRP
jgi:hypothetical protein